MIDLARQNIPGFVFKMMIRGILARIYKKNTGNSDSCYYQCYVQEKV